MEKGSKESRTKQVQFRMDPDVFYKLKSTVASDRNLHSMADLFNDAAEKYLKEMEKRGKNNDKA